MTSGEPPVLERAVEDALREQDDERRGALLHAATKDAGSAPVRALVERLLASGRRPERLLALDLAATMQPVDEELLRAAREQGLSLYVGACFEPDDRAAVAALLRAELERSDDPEMLDGAIRVAALIGAPDLVDAVLSHVAHADEDVRFACAQALPDLQPEGLTPPVVDALVALARDADDDVRDWATFALGRNAHPGPVDTPATRAVFAENAEHPHDDVRREAIDALGLLGDVEMLASSLEYDDAAIEAVETALRLADPRLHEPLVGLRDAGWADLPHLAELIDAALAACAPRA